MKHWLIRKGDGSFPVRTPEAGGPYELTLTDGQKLVLKNVMIGEVWICSGQSNMEMPLKGWGKVLDYEKEIAGSQSSQYSFIACGTCYQYAAGDGYQNP